MTQRTTARRPVFSAVARCRAILQTGVFSSHARGRRFETRRAHRPNAPLIEGIRAAACRWLKTALTPRGHAGDTQPEKSRVFYVFDERHVWSPETAAKIRAAVSDMRAREAAEVARAREEISRLTVALDVTPRWRWRRRASLRSALDVAERRSRRVWTATTAEMSS